MNRLWHTLLRGTCLAISAAAIAGPLSAAGPTQQRREAEQIVAEALFHETLGLNGERDKLLAEAQQTSPDSAAVRWARGQVKHNDRWLDAEELPEIISGSLARYEKKRSESSDTASGHWSLARYCQRNGLDQQARAHLVRVLEFDPNHAEVRRELGFVSADNRWVHQDDIRLASEAAKQSRENFERWQKKLLDLRHDLTARAKAQREAAANRLAAIDDPTAIPAIETLLCYQEGAISGPAVNTLGAMTTPEASLALARISVHAPIPETRRSAAQFLHGRPLEQFVPNLLAAPTTVAEARELVTVDANGRLIHQQVIVREKQDQNELLVRGTEYRRQYVGGGSRNFALWQAGLDMALQNADAAQRLALENMSTQERNQRITSTLAAATDTDLGLDPKPWWDWWNKYNDLQVSTEKPLAMQLARRSVSVLDGVPDYGSGGAGTFSGGSGGGGSNPECFVAGTLVRTASGERAIEKIRVGDLVLAQDIETGELAYKPVLKTTITPTGPLMRVEAGNDDTFECTGGHLFWVSGEGWKQARELKSGMPLHTPRGTVPVSHVASRAAAETYNLVVADFHTYFAGQRPVLCHDNTLRTPTRAIVPGVIVK